MTDDFERLADGIGALTHTLLVRGWAPEDIAAAFVVEGVATSRATDGDENTAELLLGIADYING